MTWVLDWDGVLWLADTPIAGAANAVAELRSAAASGWCSSPTTRRRPWPRTWPSCRASGSRPPRRRADVGPGRGQHARPRIDRPGVCRRRRGGAPAARGAHRAHGPGRRGRRRVPPRLRLRPPHRRLPGRAVGRPPHRHQRRRHLPDADRTAPRRRVAAGRGGLRLGRQGRGGGQALRPHGRAHPGPSRAGGDGRGRPPVHRRAPGGAPRGALRPGADRRHVGARPAREPEPRHRGGRPGRRAVARSRRRRRRRRAAGGAATSCARPGRPARRSTKPPTCAVQATPEAGAGEELEHEPEQQQPLGRDVAEEHEEPEDQQRADASRWGTARGRRPSRRRWRPTRRSSGTVPLGSRATNVAVAARPAAR